VPGIADVKSVVGDLPYMTVEQATTMTRMIQDHDVRDMLELGFCHGVSTCYIAAAPQARGDGHVVSIDRATRLSGPTQVGDLLERLNLREQATLFYEYSSYNWRLYHFLTQEVVPEYDLIYIDGAHTWEADGFAFLLAEQLLAPGGHIVFDDVNWSFAKSESAASYADNMPSDERDLQQVRLVCEQLVKPHPNVEEFWEDRGWAFARKRNDGRERLDHASRDAALAIIKRDAQEVRERSEHAVQNKLWEYQPWPGTMQASAAAASRRELHELRHLAWQIEKLLAERPRRG
jgi:predicted O-methyltransferase YrrM